MRITRMQSLVILSIFLMILSLSFSSDIYAGAILYGSDAYTQELYIIDQTNASTIKVGSFGVDGYMAGLAYDVDNDIMYGTTTGTDKLYSINYTTGHANLIGDLGFTLMHGLAYDNSSNTLFGAFGMSEGDGLYKIDVDTGSSTLIGHIGYFYSDHRNTVHGLAIHQLTNELYGIISGPSEDSVLIKINKTTGDGIFLWKYSSIHISGLTFLPDGTLYATDNWTGELYRLNTISSSTQLIGNTGFEYALGLTSVPEPSSLLLLGIGAFILRRKI